MHSAIPLILAVLLALGSQQNPRARERRWQCIDHDAECRSALFLELLIGEIMPHVS